MMKPLVFAAIMDHYASGDPMLTDGETLARSDTAIHEDDDEVGGAGGEWGCAYVYGDMCWGEQMAVREGCGRTRRAWVTPGFFVRCAPLSHACVCLGLVMSAFTHPVWWVRLHMLIAGCMAHSCGPPVAPLHSGFSPTLCCLPPLPWRRWSR